MIRPALAAAACVGLALAVPGGPTRGEEYNRKNWFEKHNDPAGKPDGRVRSAELSGYSGPGCLRKHTQPSKEPHYLGGYVGGGCLFRKHRTVGGPEPGPVFSEGTFGWDYVGFGKYPGRVFLGWCRCDNKKLIPGPYDQGPLGFPEDVFAEQPVKEKFRELGREEEEEGHHAEHEEHGEEHGKGHGENGHGGNGHGANGHGEAHPPASNGHAAPAAPNGHAAPVTPYGHVPATLPATVPH